MNVENADTPLVLRAQAGDQVAFGVLVGKYRVRVMKLSMRYTRNRADAEDAVQETFIKAYGGLRNFRGEACFYSWLHRIAINSARTVRDRRPSRWLCICDIIQMSAPPEKLRDWDTPEELALTEELGWALSVALHSLPDEQRTAIELREFEGCSYSSIAVSMSCPMGTVRSRIFRARDAINSYLRNAFEDRSLRLPVSLAHQARESFDDSTEPRYARSRYA
jgi:RNA polymerase sigma-70 factor (ECF subfamily)